MRSSRSMPSDSRRPSSATEMTVGRGGVSPLDQAAQFLKGVGPKRAELLARLDIRTARDLLFHVPRRYEDVSTVTRIGKVEIGQDATVIGEVVAKGVLPTRSGLRIFQAVLRDSSGQIEASWPGQPFLDRTIRKGDLLLVTGPVRFFHGRQITPREYIVLGSVDDDGGGTTGKVLPIYATTEGLSQKVLRSILDQNLDKLLPLLQPEDPLPQALAQRHGLPTLMQAVQQLHRPSSLAEAEQGRRRLAYEELFFLQLLHARAQRRERTHRSGVAFVRSDRLIAPLYRKLPFELTAAQTRAIAEIFGDMTAPYRMNRLLQGDVGSGKTIVALFAMLLAAENGMQSALMAPTEILAEQHARTIRALLEGIEVESVLLTGRMGTRERRTALEQIRAGAASIVIGTHALIQEGVRFHRLGLAIVDEQHRFGVRQRQALGAAGASGGGTIDKEPGLGLDEATEAPSDLPPPDTLVMSATPIPRSLALTLYGDLDLTVIDELPPNRRPVRTAVRQGSVRSRVYDFVRDQVAEGRQAYIVYPLVEESDKVDLKAATAEYQRLAAEEFADLRVGLLHGQLAGEEKDATMRAFAAGELDILVATTVIEVGIDVPNATVMIVEHAERFGLSQLHQLRGRVGRGAADSYCILISDGGPDAIERLQILARTDDGFEVARADLQLRGMGDVFGARQHGLPDFRFFDPERDEDLLLAAREDARALVERDPELEAEEHAKQRAALKQRFGEREALFGVG
jgi:ATP-dependent DNA helicase RecG